MSTNVTISDIDAYFSVSVIAEVEVNENNLNHYAPLPANYSEKDYKSDRIKLRDYMLKREADLTKDNLTEKEKLDVKAIKKRIAEYPIRDKEPHKVGDIIETWRIRPVETESDLEWVYKWHLKKRLENNAFANIIYFINDEVKQVQVWINWITENNPNWDKRDMLHQYLDLLSTKLKSYSSNGNAKPLEKIEWLGTQQELADLLIELKLKGWIDKFQNKTIKACFTQSNSIQEYLKPGTEKIKTTDGKIKYEDNYEKAHTIKYKRKFFGILKNKKTETER